MAPGQPAANTSALVLRLRSLPHIETMTTARFRDLLQALHWSNRQLATVLAIKEATVEAWADGDEPVPDNIATWLEMFGAVHEEHPLPADWYGARRRPAAARIVFARKPSRRA
jgi:hypothetical protein